MAVNTNSLRRILGHRGPDSEGMVNLQFGANQLYLTHTRLAIQDLSDAGHQPMRSRDGRWWLSFNGEIYNHLEIRNKLHGDFNGHSDTETLVEALSQLGIRDTLGQLNGMFAFAAVDTESGEIFLARDPFGIKPIYYCRTTNNEFAFCSEVRGLRFLNLAPSEVCAESLQAFLALRYVPSPKTIWRGINRLPPGYLLTFDVATGQLNYERYVKLSEDRFDGSLEEAISTYHEVLESAVQRQLLSDVPVGVLLSGGIDSALVGALAVGAGAELSTFTVGFEGDHKENELEAAAKTAKTLKLPNTPVVVNANDLWRVFPPTINAIEEPLGTPSILAMWYLVARARQDVTVVLTGQGSDEPWGGYRRYQSEVLRSMMPWPASLRALQPVANLTGRLPEYVSRGLRSLPQADNGKRFAEAYSLFGAEERRALTGCSADGGALQAIQTWLRWYDAPGREPVEKMMGIDTRMNLADDLLLYGDKVSMAVSLEARVPVLDSSVVRFVESLPRSYRIRLNRTKVVHKLMAERYLPKEIVHRPKLGFQIPFDRWIREQWSDQAEDLLFAPGAAHLNFIDADALRTIWNDHMLRGRNRGRQLFSLLSLAIWSDNLEREKHN